MPASECGSPPPFLIVSSEMHTNMHFGKNGSRDQSLRNQTIVISIPVGPPYTHLTLSPLKKEVARVGVPTSMANEVGLLAPVSWVTD